MKACSLFVFIFLFEINGIVDLIQCPQVTSKEIF